MNRSYIILLKNIYKCRGTMPEIMKDRGKNSTGSVFSRSVTKIGAGLAAPLIAAGILLHVAPGFAGTVTDKYGASCIGTGKVHNIYAQKFVESKNEAGRNRPFAVNRFKEFKVAPGEIVNMYFGLQKKREPEVDKLVNLVNSRISVNGTVNAVKNNRIGGELFFLSPNGMTVGSTGVINAGRVVALAPSSSYFYGNDGSKGIWTSDARLSQQFYNDIAGNEAYTVMNYRKRNLKEDVSDEEPSIRIAGKINARSGIVLGAKTIVIPKGGTLQSNKDIDFTNLVNAKDKQGNIVTNTVLANTNLTMVPDVKSGDIILQVQPLIVVELLIEPDRLLVKEIEARSYGCIDVNGEVKADKDVVFSLGAGGYVIHDENISAGGGVVYEASNDQRNDRYANVSLAALSGNVPAYDGEQIIRYKDTRSGEIIDYDYKKFYADYLSEFGLILKSLITESDEKDGLNYGRYGQISYKENSIRNATADEIILD